MGKTLGICVSSDKNLDKIINICRAARQKDVEVMIFFTHLGTRLTQDPRFGEIVGIAKIGLCKVGFEANQLMKAVEGLDDRCFASQSWHAEMILDCDRYLTL